MEGAMNGSIPVANGGEENGTSSTTSAMRPPPDEAASASQLLEVSSYWPLLEPEVLIGASGG